MSSKSHVVVVGSGGREHCISWKLAQSPKVGKVTVIPGNGGTSGVKCGEVEIVNESVSFAENFSAVVKFCKDQNVKLVVVGMEAPLVDGIADALTAAGLSVFGPSKAAAQLEGSKAFCKAFMDRHKVPTAAFQTFKGKEALPAALKFIDESPFDCVVKASGLAAGKGVIVPTGTGAAAKDEAKKAVHECMESGLFGAAGEEVVIEEKLVGPEVSVFAFCDGKTFITLAPSQDHKRAYDNDEGPNTGGMGAYAPAPVCTPEILEEIEQKVIKPTVDGMAAEGTPFVGVLFAGLMLTARGPLTLEFNVRLGDPETQVVLPLLKSDLYEILEAGASGSISSLPPVSYSDGAAVCVVLASGGYPGSYPKGKKIFGLEEVAGSMHDVVVFHAGTKKEEDGSCVTSGGRVLGVTALCDTLLAAKSRAYDAVKKIQWEGVQFRSDIAEKAFVPL
uniref:phosphoribosylamine--glycine ligase n=1 Tax=Chromera velia CCMP2878 TaxID=1169474 RepID=A0A0G4F9J7_9ALVE|mmetsp:Transcript_2711/g.5598  ORF Transcript_2711/g.5598 Transcript_2711/m.5598 type:complete len:447 (-) Transcript_2711:672-2012(-)|eukprot:Cvel_15742.t1-p1 / transcript=Cvel_15742.t1 / gene=Cvel_15742 / organism=Chromera_velia_CCMP2878 / gene_product=Phosphoribosylamine--glycine ligase, putative / transcript_product=Phosphoribosylamine--glycine ligase, putative / location=Cvel_scaffold1178:12024-17872(-) / protein_length=446 / sequence_SO=supercontig / SO=protein_coding / is_pseudo=false